jgi:hypothetical protein
MMDSVIKIETPEVRAIDVKTPTVLISEINKIRHFSMKLYVLLEAPFSAPKIEMLFSRLFHFTPFSDPGAVKKVNALRVA